MHPASSEQTQEHLASGTKSPRKDRKKLANLAFKTAFVPTSVQQVRKLEQGFGTARFAYNWALDAWEARRTSKTPNSFIKLRNQLNSVKSSEFPWMAEVPKDIPAEAIRDLTTAFKNFFDKKLKARYPQRKKKGRARFAFRLPADRLRWREVSGDDGQPLSEVYLSSIGWVALREQFQPIGKVVYATVSRKADRYFVSFCMEYEPAKRVRQVRKPKSVGIDLGLKHTLTLSSGVKLASPRSLAHKQMPLARLNRQLHRRVKGSRNRGKAAKRLAKLHARVANIRRDFTEKTTTNLLRCYDIVAVEDLNVAALLKTGRYGRSLSDSALGSIVQALHRKAAKYGCHVQDVDRFFLRPSNAASARPKTTT